MALAVPNRRRAASLNGSRRSALDEVAARYGFRRIECVHIRLGRRGTTATVTGIAHRYPRSVRVPLDVAERLVAAGAPCRTERVAGD